MRGAQKSRSYSVFARLKRTFFWLLFAASLGLFFRFFLSSSFIHQRIVRLVEQNNSPVEVKFTRASFSLADGWQPHFSLRLTNLHLSDKVCKTDIFKSPDLFLTLDFISLFKGHFKLKKAVVKGGELNSANLNFGKCSVEKNEISHEKIDPIIMTAKVFNKTFDKKLNDFIGGAIKRINWYDSFPKIKKILGHSLPVNHVIFTDLGVIVKTKGESELRLLSDADLYFFKDQRIKFEGLIKSVKWGDSSYDKQKIDIDLDLNNEGMQVSSVIRLREGSWAIDINLADDGKLKISSKADKVPLSRFKDLGLYSEDFSLHYLWFQCLTNYEGLIHDWQSAPLVINNCSIKGPHGEVAIKDGNVNPWRGDPFKVNIKKLELDKIFNTRRELFLSGIFNQYGNLDGDISYKFDEGLNFVGSLENASVVFSRAGSRVAQEVDIKLKVHFLDRLSISVDDAKLNQGFFKGQMSLSYSIEKQEGVGQVAIRSLKFKPEVFKILLNSDIESLGVYGRLNWEEKTLKSWEGFFVSPKIWGDGLIIKNIKAQSNFLDQQFNVNLSFTQAEVDNNSNLFIWIKPLFLANLPEKLNIREASSKIIITKKQVEWSSGFISLADGSVIETEGKNVGKEFDFNLRHLSKKDQVAWKIKGPFKKMLWKPLSNQMEDWIRDHPEFSSQFPNVVIEKQDKSL